uniref:NADH-ubiquinone oxidoreductase chain 5 n=1 Tax=Mytilus coruscus TaxID=42192 RepID=A0A075E2U8_MYTCO|nr:NADH dehydrogenase subunit 5 [Mytilus coruscus]AIA77027.1 NADH dehydrogenase subunit 5 [Mytilus coruscus]AZZ73316.1 NADH dehydrogenase subunit 5 [Mytilus coruscus]
MKLMSSNLPLLVLICSGYLSIFTGSILSSAYLLEVPVWDSHCLSFSFSILADNVSMIFVGTVLVISGSVATYCKWYMASETYYNRFMGLVWLFVLSMIFMILVPNLVMLLIGWDGLGLTSFLLVAYYQNNKSLSAAMLTALTNRIGDVLVLVSISILLNEGGWLVYSYYPVSMWSGLSVVVVLAGMTKSAQMPFCAWLPAAMAAPTPVSSLVHSSTLVTAGVYLVLRSFYVVSANPLATQMLMILSLFTLVLAGSSAVFAFDLKKVIALSTLSQLSLMMFSISILLPFVAFFHLVTHAVFKALLFLGAGGVIHSNQSIQDIRGLSSLWQSLPVSMSAMSVAIVSLSGAPFMSGFYSKDLIIELSMMDSSMTYGCYMLELLGLIFTSFYSARIVFSVMLGSNYINCSTLRLFEHLNMQVPFLSLYVGAIFLGLSLGSTMEKFGYVVVLESYESLSIFLIPFVGLAMWWGVLTKLGFNPWSWTKMLSFFLSMWLVESLTSHPGKTLFFKSSLMMYQTLDQGWLELLGPQGVYAKLGQVSQLNEVVQSNYFTYQMVAWSLVTIAGLSLVVFM